MHHDKPYLLTLCITSPPKVYIPRPFGIQNYQKGISNPTCKHRDSHTFQRVDLARAMGGLPDGPPAPVPSPSRAVPEGCLAMLWGTCLKLGSLLMAAEAVRDRV